MQEKKKIIHSREEYAEELLIREEGEHLEAYQDSEGYWTIAIGHRLDILQSEEELAALGLEEELEDWEGFTVTKEGSASLFKIDLQEAIHDLYPAFSEEDLNKLDPVRFAVIVSMAFQMGGAGVRKFRNFIKAVKAQEWQDAAREMEYANYETQRRSKWYIQTPQRCIRASQMMATGVFCFEIGSDKVERTRFEGGVDLSDIPRHELLKELLRREEEVDG